MNEVLDFLNKAGVYYLATMEGDQPRVRPLGFVMEWGGKLTFCTSNEKKMYRQLVANPKAEICCFDGESTLRVCGKAVFATTNEAQRRALEVMPALCRMYSVGDGKFEVFCLEEGKAVFAGMSGDSKEISF